MCLYARVKFLGSSNPEDPKCDDECYYDIDPFDLCGELRSDACNEQLSRTLADIVYAPLSCWKHVDVMAEQRKHFWNNFLRGMADPTTRLHEKWANLDQDVQVCILTFWPRLKSMAKSDWDRKFGGIIDDFRANRALYQDPHAKRESSTIRLIVRFIDMAKNAVADDDIVVPHMPLARQPWKFTSIFGSEAPGIRAANNATNGQHRTPQPCTVGPAMVPAPPGLMAAPLLPIVRDGLVLPTQAKGPGQRKRYSEEPHSFQPRQLGSVIHWSESHLPPGAQPSGSFSLPSPLRPTKLPAGTQMVAAPCSYNRPPFTLPFGTLPSQPPAHAPPPVPVPRAAVDWLTQRHLYCFQLYQNPETRALKCVQWGTRQTLDWTEAAGAIPHLQGPSVTSRNPVSSAVPPPPPQYLLVSPPQEWGESQGQGGKAEEYENGE
ncbi:hypothetical protein MMYC01_210465 [Madurella mycetomatis]|uniref:Uncharacterized protein n=1 Tax=Madurella mycetomatis TaxID=100816 RepID=A0A175VP66_9PEZI|nr:hypothetical protein MMYC01_210465 [Madurella mycetomatis]